VKLTSRSGEVSLDIARIIAENKDSSKNLDRDVKIIPLQKIVVHYWGAESCSSSFNEYILLEPGKNPVILEPVREVREEANGKYTIIREYTYIIIDDRKIQVEVRELERIKTKLVVSVAEENNKIYVNGDTYDIKDKLKAHGFYWDQSRKAWYTDKLSKNDVVEILKSLGVEVA
jgi:hypothetical protein